MSRFDRDWVGLSKLLIFPISLAPLTMLLWAGGVGGLGPDPAKSFVDQTGIWAIRFLLASLAMTPLRYLTHRSFWIRYRRMLGLFALFYAVVHVGGYVFLLFGGRWDEIAAELSKRPYVMVGALTLLLMLPLGVTSTRGWQRRMRGRWVKLHRLVYPVAVLALVHFAWANKLGLSVTMPYVLTLAVLFGVRIWHRFQHLKKNE